MTLADVPLDVRVSGALEAIVTGAVAELAERYAVLAVALWPPPVTVTGEVPEPPQERGVHNSWPSEVRVAAVGAYLAGEGSFSVIADRFGLPAGTLKLWVQKSRRGG